MKLIQLLILATWLIVAAALYVMAPAIFAQDAPPTTNHQQPTTSQPPLFNALKNYDEATIMVGIPRIQQIHINWIFVNGELDPAKVAHYFKAGQFTLIDGVEGDYKQKDGESWADYLIRIRGLADQHGQLAERITAMVPGCELTFYHIVGRDLFNGDKLAAVKRGGRSAFNADDLELMIEREGRREAALDAIVPGLYAPGRCTWLAWGCYKLHAPSLPDTPDTWTTFAAQNTRFYRSAGVPVVAFIYHLPIDASDRPWSAQELRAIGQAVHDAGGSFAPWSKSTDDVRLDPFTTWHESLKPTSLFFPRTYLPGWIPTKAA